MNTLRMRIGVMICMVMCMMTVIGAQAALEVPDNAQLHTLVNKTLLDFALAVKAKDFTGFYRNISRFWQEQTTKEDLLEAFAPFVEQDIDLTALQKYDPVFTQQPYIDNNDWLILQGYYPTRPSITFFTLKYVYEEAWKLVGIDINVKPAAERGFGMMPSEEQYKQLVDDTMLDFALAVKAKDFTGFYENISKIWQEQTTPEKLANIFRSFIEQEIDLTVLEDFEPVFDEEPFMNEDGLLVLRGYYPTRPSVVVFEVSYISEETGWKLFGINVNVVPAEEVSE